MSQGCFDTKEPAQKVYDEATKRLEEKADHSQVYIPFSFKDDYGFSYTINLLDYSIILMPLEQSVKMEVILQKAVEKARQQAGVTTVPQGFVQQPAGLRRPQ